MLASQLKRSISNPDQCFKSNEQTETKKATDNPFGAAIKLETEQKLEQTDSLGDTALKEIDNLMQGPRDNDTDKNIEKNFNCLPLDKQIKVYKKIINTQTGNSKTFQTGPYTSIKLSYTLLLTMQNDADNLQKSDPNMYQKIIENDPNCDTCILIKAFVKLQRLQQGKIVI